jgi:hypothetical protein
MSSSDTTFVNRMRDDTRRRSQTQQVNDFKKENPRAYRQYKAQEAARAAPSSPRKLTIVNHSAKKNTEKKDHTWGQLGW